MPTENKKSKNKSKNIVPKDKKSAKKMSELEHFKQLAKDNLAGWQRAKADYQNLIKRTAEDAKKSAIFSNEQLILEILPVLDNFRHAINHVPENLQDDAWVQGVTFIKTQLENILSDQGVKEVEVEGENFDPEKHDAIEQVKSDLPKDSIVEVLQPGYEMNGKIIRAAKVKVAK